MLRYENARGSAPLLVLLIALLAIAGGLALYQRGIVSLPPSIAQALPQQFFNRLEVLTPGPLRGSFDIPAVKLTRPGVLIATNHHRQQNQLETLRENAQLNQAAEAKLHDMFAQQYFDHVGPDKRGSSDWVEDVGYAYLSVGENLALGNFRGDEALVQAWMDSPGHRANILHAKFTEIGIAVGEGTFEGQQTWLAVQTFALPESACPAPTKAQKAHIDVETEALTTLSASLSRQQQNVAVESKQLAERRAEIEAMFEQAETEEQVEEAEAAQAAYNKQVEQFQAKQQSFNAAIDTFKQREEKLQGEIENYNQKVRQQQTCAETA